MKRHPINTLPPKFVGITKVAIKNEIARHTALINDDNTPDEILADIDYGNDIPILKGVLDEMENPHQTVMGDLYVLSQTADGTETTLQRFGKPIPTGETIKWVFLAKDFDEACAIKNQLMGFEPYKPMSKSIAINERYVLKKNKERYALEVIIYQPQNFGGIWQCDYHIGANVPDFDNIYQTTYDKNGLNVLKSAIKSVENHLTAFRKLGFKVLVNQMVNRTNNMK
ncbi:Uncharacterised protein [Moraxella lacunata]|uniref:Uncharacterized protein n=1 Tax=Moraxella lacunata TaxID=477 RepID=A0A378TT69_MORLA|nr:hypothetical protein [Moraxella lacunata]STZ63140.1 Uncharacterised protein [Moraxella lacunata]